MWAQAEMMAKVRGPLAGQIVIGVIAVLDPLSFDDMFSILNHAGLHALQKTQIAKLGMPLKHRLLIQMQRICDYERVIDAHVAMMGENTEIDVVEGGEVIAGTGFSPDQDIPPFQRNQPIRIGFRQIGAPGLVHLYDIVVAVITDDEIVFTRAAAVGQDVFLD
jgi:hypothetical protein